MEISPHASSSAVQTEAEQVILAAFAAREQIVLVKGPGRVSVGDDVWVEVDAHNVEQSVLVEAYARQGRLKGAQLKKVAQDILKLALVRRQSKHAQARSVIVFASPEAYQSVTGWVRHAAKAFDVELTVVDIPEHVRDRIIAAQERQKMTNIELPVSDIADDVAVERPPTDGLGSEDMATTASRGVPGAAREAHHGPIAISWAVTSGRSPRWSATSDGCADDRELATPAG